jgi:hypothetical protein
MGPKCEFWLLHKVTMRCIGFEVATYFKVWGWFCKYPCKKTNFVYTKHYIFLSFHSTKIKKIKPKRKKRLERTSMKCMIFFDKLEVKNKIKIVFYTYMGHPCKWNEYNFFGPPQPFCKLNQNNVYFYCYIHVANPCKWKE